MVPTVDTRQLLEQAVACHRSGAMREAETLYRQVLARDPDNPDALHLLGTLRMRAGDLEESIPFIQRAIAKRGDVAAYHNSLGNALRKLGRNEEARASYKHALALQPRYALAHTNLANLSRECGALDLAATHYRKALDLEGTLSAAWLGLGHVHSDRRQYDEAHQCYRQVLRVDPTSVDAARGIADLLVAQGKLVDGVKSYAAALALAPTDGPTLTNFANLLHQLGERQAALTLLRRARVALPDSPLPRLALANVLKDAGALDDAVAEYKAALAADPNLAEAWAGLGTLQSMTGDFPDAIACLRKAIDVDGAMTDALGELVHQLQHICDWRDLPRLQEQLLRDFSGPAMPVVSPFILLGVPATPEIQLEAARRYAAPIAAAAQQAQAASAFRYDPAPHQRLRIGYLSADFLEHATAFLITELLERHDRSQLSVHAFSYGTDDGSPMRARIAGACDSFVDLRTMSDAEAARRIHADGIDILVDVKGFTRHARPGIAALRPAPVQAQWLAYPGTLGAPWLDWAIVDPIVLPPAELRWFAERPVWLPCYWVSDTSESIAPPPTRRSVGLPEHGFVFCCFNQPYKIQPTVFAQWMRLLANTSDAVLWLLDCNRWATAQLRDHAARMGVHPQRLVFAPLVTHAEHRARITLADLALDTLPYNGHTTSNDALWAGVPVVTQCGNTFAGRVTKSQLLAIGLPELVTATADEYEAMAARLATHRDELTAIRARLAALRHVAPLFDTGAFARRLERAYVAMFDAWRSGDHPQVLDFSN